MVQLRILNRSRAVDIATAERFRGLPVANVSDVMHRLNAAGARLRPLHANGLLLGVALTVKTRPGDNLVIQQALNMALPGDVIVVDAGGDVTNALVGEMMLSYAEKIGTTGMVLNGAVRDLGYIRRGTYPVFAAGVTHRGPYRNGPGEINVPIAIDGMVVEPGDLVLGDDDGLLCVPYDIVDEVLAEAIVKYEGEQKLVTQIAAGTNDRSWVDGAMQKSGHPFRLPE
jgi:regulator of RNase E activity RraA